MLRRLNRHFGKRIRISWKPLSPINACANLKDNLIKLNGDERILDPQILAHEYAHFLKDKRDRRFKDRDDQWHAKIYFESYREVCQALNISPVLFNPQACQDYAQELWGSTMFKCPKCLRWINYLDVFSMNDETFYLDQQRQPVYGEPEKTQRWYSCPKCYTTVSTDEKGAIRILKGVAMKNGIHRGRKRRRRLVF